MVWTCFIHRQHWKLRRQSGRALYRRKWVVFFPNSDWRSMSILKLESYVVLVAPMYCHSWNNPEMKQQSRELSWQTSSHPLHLPPPLWALHLRLKHHLRLFLNANHGGAGSCPRRYLLPLFYMSCCRSPYSSAFLISIIPCRVYDYPVKYILFSRWYLWKLVTYCMLIGIDHFKWRHPFEFPLRPVIIHIIIFVHYIWIWSTFSSLFIDSDLDFRISLAILVTAI